jgi:hypothetical protein
LRAVVLRAVAFFAPALRAPAFRVLVPVPLPELARPRFAPAFRAVPLRELLLLLPVPRDERDVPLDVCEPVAMIALLMEVCRRHRKIRAQPCAAVPVRRVRGRGASARWAPALAMRRPSAQNACGPAVRNPIPQSRPSP